MGYGEEFSDVDTRTWADGGELVIKGDVLLDHYKRWFKDHGLFGRELLGLQALGTEIKRMLPSKITKPVRRSKDDPSTGVGALFRAHVLPPLTQARIEFNKSMSLRIEWSEAEAQPDDGYIEV